MEIITTFLSYFWYELFFALLAIALVYLSRMKFYLYTPHNISDSVPEDFETYFQYSEEAFFELDWIRLGTFHCTHPKEENIIIARFFCSPDYNHAAMLSKFKSSDGDALYITEFRRCDKDEFSFLEGICHKRQGGGGRQAAGL